eukprot:Rhum_TRINITY_DN16987_c0_g1::Rhum_TRINITY_DN16987_c0_g1_i1::g.164964::m.164964
MAKTLETLASAAKGKPAAFPFYLSKYRAAQDVLDGVPHMPRELFDQYPAILKRSFSRKNEHPDETRILNNRPYFQKYRTHLYDTYTHAPQSVGLIGRMRAFENHLSRIEDAHVQKMWRSRKRKLLSCLSRLRIDDFPAYWKMMQDFNLWSVVRDAHQGYVDLGAFHHPGPSSSVGGDTFNLGSQKVTGIEDYMDPETLYGCEETGETRYAVTRRLGKLWEPGMQVYIKDPLDHLWKMAEVVEVIKEHKTCRCSLVAVDELIEVDWDNMKPFDVYATSRPMALSDPVRGELAESASRFTYFENLKQTDPVRFEQEWYQHICTKFYNGEAPTGSFRGWRQRFMVWDPQTKSPKQIRWQMGLTKYMQRRIYLGYPVRAETFEFGPDGKEEPWWVQHRPHYPNPKKGQKK